MRTLLLVALVFICKTVLSQDLHIFGDLQLDHQRSTIYTQGEYFPAHRGGIQFLTFNSGQTFVFQPTDANGTQVNSTLTLGGFGMFSSNIVGLAVSGNAGIGTNDTKGYKLAVAGKAIAEEMVVKLQGNWPDYVFESDYKLPSLTEVAAYIHINKHLPEMPSANEVEENGTKLGEMNMLLLKKVEELTLYIIDQNKKIDEQMKEIESLKAITSQQQKQIENLKTCVNTSGRN